jgi:predicted  nucleic acid-binding Zn-ribbon protein
MNRRQVRCILPVAAAVLVASLAAGVAWAQDDAASHVAKSEAQYDSKWMSAPDLFALYQAAHKDVAGLLDKNKTSQDHITDLNKQIAQIQSDYMKDKRPLDAEHSKIMAAGQAALNQVNTPPPAQPVDPGNNGPNRGGFTGGAAGDAQYNASVNTWNQYRNYYQQQLNDYNNRKAQWDRDRAAAQKIVETETASLKVANQKLADRLKVRDDAQKPLMTDRQQATDAMKAVTLQVNAALGKLKAMGDALRTAPEEKRLALGIVEYKDMFYSVTDFQAAVDKINTDIEAAREKVKANAGGTVPDNWRHPKQDEADTMVALLKKLKDAVAGAHATPAASAPAAKAL